MADWWDIVKTGADIVLSGGKAYLDYKSKKKQNEMNITPTKKEEQTAKGQITGKGYTGGSGFTKGGLASKPKPKPKKKRTTKGLGTKPKAT